MHVNSVDQWFGDRINRYGLVLKLSLFGKPTVLLAGPAGNKFMFFSSFLPPYEPLFAQRIIGEMNILSLHGDDHRRIRGALLEFLKQDMLKLYVKRIDAEVRHHLEENWAGRTTVTVLPLMKRLTFNIISALVFGLEASAVRDAFADDVGCMLAGMTGIPVNLPFTKFRQSLKARQRARRLLEGIMREKKAEQGNSPHKNLISHLLSLRDEHGEQVLTHEEIVDNSLIAMIAGHDTASTLMTFMIRHLANDPAALAVLVQEHEEIARNKADGEALTWVDLSNMKFTWRVAQETLRIVPVVVANFKIALEDIEFGGYRIPKGWQVCWTASATHMDPSIFPEPAKFDPSRFENLSSTTPPCSFIGFGTGPRICPGMEFAKLTCRHCGHCSEILEPFLDLSLEIDQVDNLVADLESFTKVERIGGVENKLTCDSCNAQVCKDKRFVIDEAPDVIAFQFKHFTTLDGSIEKIAKHVAYPSELDLKPFHSDLDREDLKYDLYGLVEHSGLPNFGHYVCTIRSSPSSWHLMNDSLVDSITETRALHQEAYMLFYVSAESASQIGELVADPVTSELTNHL
ncbi:hypothetical protein ACQ4PT_035997 [Festuca glaucescens]